jgi:Protein of unknown function (DUF3644)
MARMAKEVRSHLEKARSSALSAVENYNRPTASFRTRTFVVLMIIAWTALLHAVFYKRGSKPWYLLDPKSKRKRYVKIDGEPKHWELATCIERFWPGTATPEKFNLEFLIGLRNKIEHRDTPELDPALYGECQAALMNFEEVLEAEFGAAFGLIPGVAVALQFSTMRPQAQEEALRKLQSKAAQDVLHYANAFRATLPDNVAGSAKFALNLFLIPKVANRSGSADLAVEFVNYDPSKPEEMAQLERVVALIKEKRVPVVSEGLMKPKAVVERVSAELPFTFTMDTHTRAWRHYKVRPTSAAVNRARTKSEFCVFDELAEGYGYSEAWVRFLIKKLSDASEYKTVTGRTARRRR